MTKLLLKRKIIAGLAFILLFSSFISPSFVDNYSLEVNVKGLRNSYGQVVFALYNKQDAIPDKNFEKYFKKELGVISGGTSTAVFNNLVQGDYAVIIFHDENNDEEIKKGFLLPKEGIGFSNVQSIGPLNKPSFEKASLKMNGDTSIQVKILYFN